MTTDMMILRDLVEKAALPPVGGPFQIGAATGRAMLGVEVAPRAVSCANAACPKRAVAHTAKISAYTALAVLSASAAWTKEVWMVVTHEVKDFDRWQADFDHALPTRRAVGEMASCILHNPNY